MNITEFISLLENPRFVTPEQTNAIDEILESYPYFQAARVVQLEGFRQHKSYKYNNTLKTVAAYTANRSVLFDLITSDTLDIEETIEKEKRLIDQTEVIDAEEVITQEKQVKEAVTIPETTENKTIKKVEEELNIGKPLVFDISEMHSFNEWLQLTNIKPIDRSETNKLKEEKAPEFTPDIPTKTTKTDKDNRFDLIEQFIKNKPKIAASPTDENLDISVESTIENESLMTETLARVYLEQKKYDKAIQAFKILSLKYPEKSSFFADRIKAIKFLQKNNT